jgi:hypothetical protein
MTASTSDRMRYVSFKFSIRSLVPALTMILPQVGTIWFGVFASFGLFAQFVLSGSASFIVVTMIKYDIDSKIE